MTPLQKKISRTVDDLREALNEVEGNAVVEPQDGTGVRGWALAALEWQQRVDDLQRELTTLLVHHARVEQATWEQVGDALGMTRQGAWKLWGQ